MTDKRDGDRELMALRIEIARLQGEIDQTIRLIDMVREIFKEESNEKK